MHDVSQKGAHYKKNPTYILSLSLPPSLPTALFSLPSVRDTLKTNISTIKEFHGYFSLSEELLQNQALFEKELTDIFQELKDRDNTIQQCMKEMDDKFGKHWKLPRELTRIIHSFTWSPFDLKNISANVKLPCEESIGTAKRDPHKQKLNDESLNAVGREKIYFGMTIRNSSKLNMTRVKALCVKFSVGALQCTIS